MIQEEKARSALKYIIPILKKYDFKWIISGGFACYLYGVKRPIGDIDIDVEADKDDKKFKEFVEEVKEFATFPFQLWIDKNYDNWVMNVEIDGQVLSICSTENLKLFNKESGQYEIFYKRGVPKPVIILFKDLKLPISPKKWVIQMKEALAKKKPIDRKDISEMKKLMEIN